MMLKNTKYFKLLSLLLSVVLLISLYQGVAYSEQTSSLSSGENLFPLGMSRAVSSEAITVTTGTITKHSNSVDVGVTVTGSNIKRVGIVYSLDYTEPTVGNSSIKSTAVTNPISTTINLTGLHSNRYYHVRAFAEDTSGNYYYGNTSGFTSGYDSGSSYVSTGSAYDIYDTSANVVINVYNGSGSYIYENGVVYSTNSNPDISSSNSYTRTTSTSTGDHTIYLSNLYRNTKYYYCAYSKNEHGTFYGTVKSFTTGYYSNGYYNDGYYNDGYYYGSSYSSYRPTVSTTAVTRIDSRSIDVEIYVESSGYSSITDRGVVYSKTNSSPEKNSSSSYYKSVSGTTGYKTVNLTNLDSNENYYVRAYATNSYGTSYGTVRNTRDNYSSSSSTSTTTSDNTGVAANVYVTYKTTPGNTIGNQTVSTTVGSTLTASNFDLPYGHTLFLPAYSYYVSGNDSIDVAVVAAAKTEDAYMEGVGDNKFEPNRNITRLEFAKIIYNLKGRPRGVVGVGYNDVARTNPNVIEIDYVSSMGYMQGYPDGSFKPDNNITRAEASIIIYRAYDLTNASLNRSFTDIDDHWARDFVIAAASNDIITGYPNGTFLPNSNMTRAEASVVFSRAEKRNLTPLGTVNFSDVPTNHWAYRFIMNAARP